MSRLFPDTNPEAENMLLTLLRETPAWRKLEMLDQMNRTVHLFALVGLRKRYPQAGPTELHRRLADLLLGADLAEQAFGPLSRAQALDEGEPRDRP